VSVRTHLGTPNLNIILYRNLIAASCVMFTTGIASIHLVNVSIAMNRILNPPGALGRCPQCLLIEEVVSHLKVVEQRRKERSTSPVADVGGCLL
jgi:hypothetical protein